MSESHFRLRVLALTDEEVAAIEKELAELSLVAATPEVTSTTSSGGVVIYGSVFGAVQTGAGATASMTVTIDAANAAALAESIQVLRAALRAEPPSDLPAYADAVFADIETEALKPRPEARRIAALLGAGAALIESLANAPEAWANVRHAAHAMGVPLP